MTISRKSSSTKERELIVAGLPVRLRLNGFSGEVSDYICDILERFSCRSILSESSTILDIELESIRVNINEFRAPPSRNVEVDQFQDEYSIQAEGIEGYLSRRGDCIRASVSVVDRKAYVETTVLSMLAVMFSMSDRIVLHGAAIGSMSQGYIFSGKSGAGKSTMSMEFMEHGFDVLGDEFCCVHVPSNAELTIHAFPFNKIKRYTATSSGLILRGFAKIYHAQQSTIVEKGIPEKVGVVYTCAAGVRLPSELAQLHLDNIVNVARNVRVFKVGYALGDAVNIWDLLCAL